MHTRTKQTWRSCSKRSLLPHFTVYNLVHHNFSKPDGLTGSLLLQMQPPTSHCISSFTPNIHITHASTRALRFIVRQHGLTEHQRIEMGKNSISIESYNLPKKTPSCNNWIGRKIRTNGLRWKTERLHQTSIPKNDENSKLLRHRRQFEDGHHFCPPMMPTYPSLAHQR